MFLQYNIKRDGRLLETVNSFLVTEYSPARLLQWHLALTHQAYVHFTNSRNVEISMNILEHIADRMQNFNTQ